MCFMDGKYTDSLHHTTICVFIDRSVCCQLDDDCNDDADDDDALCLRLRVLCPRRAPLSAAGNA